MTNYNVTLTCELTVREPAPSSDEAIEGAEERLDKILPGGWYVTVKETSAHRPPDPDEEPTHPWQEGDEGVIAQQGGGHGFPIGEPVRMIGYDGPGAQRWRSLRTGDHWAVPPDCVKPREAPSKSTLAREAGWQVGDQGTVVGDTGTGWAKDGDRVELVRDDGSSLPWFRNLSRVTEYDPIALSLSRVRVGQRGSSEEAPAIPASATNDPTAWQVGDRFKVIDTDGGHGFGLGEVVELHAHDRTSGLLTHDYRSVTTGHVAGVAYHRLRRLDPQTPADAPTPAPGDVWDVVLPHLPDGQVSRLYVEDLTDRVVTLMLTNWKPIPGRWAPRIGAGLMRYERGVVRFVERVQD